VFVNAAGTTRRIAHSDPTHSTMRPSTRSTRSTSAAPSPRPGPSRRFSEPPAPGFWSTSRPCPPLLARAATSPIARRKPRSTRWGSHSPAFSRRKSG
jgi:hypothetical protein